MCKVLWPDIFNGLVPGYKIDGKEFYFKENVVWVERLDHALIHWGYFCDDLEPLFEYITPAQWIIDLIPRGDNRDMWAAKPLAKGEIDGIDMSGENNPAWKGGITYDMKAYKKVYNQTPERKEYNKKLRQTPERKSYMKAYQQRPEYKAYMKEYMREYHQTLECKEYDKKRNAKSERKEYMRKYMREYYARKKAEGSTTTQSRGTLEPFLG